MKSVLFQVLRQSEISDRLDPNHCKIHASNVLFCTMQSQQQPLWYVTFLKNNNFSDYSDNKQHLTFYGKLFFEGIFFRCLKHKDGIVKSSL